MIGKISSRGKWKCTRERITRRGKWLSIHEEDSQWWFETRSEVCDKTREREEERKGFRKWRGEKKEKWQDGGRGANQDRVGFKISMVENVLAASVPPSNVGVEGKQPHGFFPQKWPRHKGIRRMREHVPLSRILKRATYPRFSRYFRPTIFRPFALSRRLSSAYFFSRVSKEWYNLYGIEYPDNLTALFRFVDEFSSKRVAISLLNYYLF